VVINGQLKPVMWKRRGTWTELNLPAAMPDQPASVVAVKLKEPAKVDTALGIHPNIPTPLLAEFAEVSGAEKKNIRWMEKFGEWKAACQVSRWSETGKAVWTVDVCEAGDYRVELAYKGEGRLVWRIETDEGVTMQNQQNATAVYEAYPFGLLTFKTPGKHTLTVTLVEGDREKASLYALHARPTE
jgi:alpha-L-fucosidase